jgi:hypothetical protein
VKTFHKNSNWFTTNPEFKQIPQGGSVVVIGVVAVVGVVVVIVIVVVVVV